MVTKCLGILLIVMGVGMAWETFWPLVGEMMLMVWQLSKVLVMLFVAFIGYRLLRQRSTQEFG